MWPSYIFFGAFDPYLWIALPAVVGIICHQRGWSKGRASMGAKLKPRER